MIRDSDCDFCDRLDGDPRDRPWYDFTVLDGNETFVVVAALGALAPGHIMIVSVDHHDSMADMSASALRQLHSLVVRWAEILRRHWGSAFVFEHGGRSGSGACIFHAHLQLMPIADARVPVEPAESRQIQGLDELPELASGRSYLLTWDSSGIFVNLSGRLATGQFMRRHIADLLGRTDQWDYLVYPGLENIQLTLDELGSGTLA